MNRLSVALLSGLLAASPALKADTVARIGERMFEYFDLNGYEWLDDKCLFRNWSDGAVAYLCGDVYDYDSGKDPQWGSLGTKLTLRIGDGCAAVWDFDGYSLSYRMGPCFVCGSGQLTFQNGAIYQLSGSYPPAFDWSGGSDTTIVLEDDFAYLNTKGDEVNAQSMLVYGYADVSNCQVIVNGAMVHAGSLYNFDRLGDNCSIVVKGSSDVRINSWTVWAAGPESFRVQMKGGWWNLDPQGCNRAAFSDSYVVLDFGDDHGELPERYRVFDNVEGWTFDARRDFGLEFPSVTLDAPATPIPVCVNNAVIDGRMMLADMSSVAVNGNLQFVSATDGVKVSFHDGRLYASPAMNGFMIIVK